MSEKQYGYRFYDGAGCFGPLPKEAVLAKMDNDLSVIPVERSVILGGRSWSPWKDSDDFKGTDDE